MSTKKSAADRTRPAVRKKKPEPAVAAKTAKRYILIVDDHPMTREGLASVINREPDLEVCGLAGNPAEAMTALSRCKPDLMVTDMTMPGRSGVEFIKDIRAMMPKLPILVVSMHDEALHAERALRAGARGYLMKDAGSAKILEVIRMILAGRLYASPQMTARLLESMSGNPQRKSKSPVEDLSDREFEVFQRFGFGRRTKEIAAELGISGKTVAAHRAAIKEKLGLADGSALIHYAIRWVESEEERA